MRRFRMVALAAMLAVLTFATGSTAAWADGPQHVQSTFPVVNTQPAGAFCNFNYEEVATVSVNAVIFPDRQIDQITIFDTHTNLDTGFALTEADYLSAQFAADGQQKTVGIFWHLRNAEGKLVVVQAGQLVISPTGEILKVTPDLTQDYAAVICTALVGQPAI